MTQRVSTLAIQATTANNRRQFVGVQACPVSTDTDWLIFLRQTSFDSPKNVQFKFVMVDNIANNGIATIKIGPFSYSVPQFTRKSFRLPDDSDSVSLSLTTGSVTLYFVETADLLTDDANLYNISTAAGTNVVYTWVSETAAVVNQTLVAHSNKNIAFSKVGGQTYNLLAVSTVPNGYVNPQIWNIGPGDLTITPNGADTINSGLYSNANPLVLNAGEQITLSCDGTQWFAPAFNFRKNFRFGTLGINCDAIANNLTPISIASRANVNKRFEFSLRSGTDVALYGFDRNTSTYCPMQWDGASHAWNLSAVIAMSLGSLGLNFAGDGDSFKHYLRNGNITTLSDGNGAAVVYTPTDMHYHQIGQITHISGSVTITNGDGFNAMFGFFPVFDATRTDKYRITAISNAGLVYIFRVKALAGNAYVEIFDAAMNPVTSLALNNKFLTFNGTYSL